MGRGKPKQYIEHSFLLQDTPYIVGYVQRSIASTVSAGLVLKHSFEDGGAF
jgi:hypothetical protein